MSSLLFENIAFAKLVINKTPLPAHNREGKSQLEVAMEKCRKCHAELPEGAKFCPSCGTKQSIQQRTKSRGNGTGSVYKRENGTWVAFRVLRYSVDDNGKMHKVTASKSGFKTKRDALAYLPNLTQESKREQQKQITFLQLYDKWEPTHRAGKDTINCYRAAKKHFRPVWYLKMSEITVDDLQECMDDVPGKRTQENMKALCGLLYKYAIPRHIATLNIGPYLVVGGAKGIGKEGLPLADLQKLEKQVGKIPYADYIVADCYLGFRPSELLELDVSDYNPTDKTITGGAKTDAGRNRIVPVSPVIQSTIDRLTAGRTSGALFGDTSGERMRLEVYREHFYNALEACGIENPIIEVNGQNRRTYTPHSCRHTFATMMKDVKAPDKDKLSLIGHTSTEMLRHYQDTEIDGLRKIVNELSSTKKL